MDKGQLQSLSHPLGTGQASGGYPEPLWSLSQSRRDKMAIVFPISPIWQKSEMKEADMHNSKFMLDERTEKGNEGEKSDRTQGPTPADSHSL